jgi:hypothetical protein
MGRDRGDRTFKVRRRVGLTLIAALPLFFLFASVGEVERGLAAAFLAYIAATAFQLCWRHHRQIWFWCLVAAMGIAGIVQVFAIDWPRLDSHGGLLWGYGAAAANSLVWYGLFMLAPRLSNGTMAAVPVRCRECGLPAEKGTARCANCGTWRPAPVPVWPIGIALSPLVLVVLVVLAI